MENLHDQAYELLDLEPETGDLRRDALAGLRRSPRMLPAKYFYDARGSALFEQICDLPEYYPTRCELVIMQEHAAAMARRLGAGVRLVELGSGSSLKTRYLLDVLEEPAAYVPVDISRAALQDSCRRLHREYPGLDLRPVCADFTKPFPLPEGRRPAQRSVVYFPGSTVGNFTPDAAVPLLALMAEEVGPRGGLLIGVDLKKDPHVLHRAYNDARGITAAFDLNLLHRLNRECGADFQLDCWRHYAFYNPHEGRVEMHLISCRDQEVVVAGETFFFASGESICTEYSYKFEPKAFAALAARAGFTTVETWTDPRRHFGVVYLEVAS